MEILTVLDILPGMSGICKSAILMYIVPKLHIVKELLKVMLLSDVVSNPAFLCKHCPLGKLIIGSLHSKYFEHCSFGFTV